MRTRNTPGSEQEKRALEAIPSELVSRLFEERGTVPMGLICEILDAYDAARAAGATAGAIIETLGLSSTVLITRWRRRRLKLMRLLEPIIGG